MQRCRRRRIFLYREHTILTVKQLVVNCVPKNVTRAINLLLENTNSYHQCYFHAAHASIAFDWCRYFVLLVLTNIDCQNKLCTKNL